MASTRWLQAYPISWQGWLLTLAYSVFVLVMVGLAEELGNRPFTYGVIAFVVLVTFAYVRVIYRHLRPRREPKG